MIHDAALPAGFRPATRAAERSGVSYVAAAWTPSDLENVARQLQTRGRKEIARVSGAALLEAWSQTVETFRNPLSPERQTLDPALIHLCQLSKAGVNAGLEAVLGGVSRAPAATLEAQIGNRESILEKPPFLVVVRASNLPGLAVQSLLPALLLRCPVILKSPTSEPLFAPAFVNSLVARLPGLDQAIAAITWMGGDQALETPLIAAADRILAYGEASTLADLESRAQGKVFGYGPKTSLAVVSQDSDPTDIAAGLARDITLFDQRGCLSIQAIFTDSDPRALAQELAVALRARAVECPPGRIDPVAAAGVQQIRSEASMRGLYCADLPLTEGTVVVEPEVRFRPTPGLRTVRIHPLSSIATLPEALIEWSGRLQGAALAGHTAWSLKPALEQLGLSRFAVPGELQSPDVTWHNGGVHPFTALTGRDLGTGADD